MTFRPDTDFLRLGLKDSFYFLLDQMPFDTTVEDVRCAKCHLYLLSLDSLFTRGIILLLLGDFLRRRVESVWRITFRDYNTVLIAKCIGSKNFFVIRQTLIYWYFQKCTRRFFDFAFFDLKVAFAILNISFKLSVRFTELIFVSKFIKSLPEF